MIKFSNFSVDFFFKNVKNFLIPTYINIMIHLFVIYKIFKKILMISIRIALYVKGRPPYY